MLVCSQAPSGEHFKSWKAAKDFCDRNGIKLPSEQEGASKSGKDATNPGLVTLADLQQTLRRLAEGSFKKIPAKVQDALLRARVVRCVKRQRGAQR